MKLLSQLIIFLAPFITGSVFACTPAEYQSKEGASLSLLSNLIVRVKSKESKRLIYSGHIEGYIEDPENGMYSVIPDESSLGKNGTIHLGGNCQYIKMYWWTGGRFESDFHKHLFKRST